MTDTQQPRPPVAAVTRSDNDRKQMPRERPSYTGGLKLKLKVFGEIPGYHMFWENDQDAAIEQLLEYGFDFVTMAEAKLQSRTQIVADSDLGERVSKYVGTKDDGTPLRAYLMKCPEDLWQEIQAVNQQQADEWDKSILRGDIQNVENRYVPKGYQTKLTSGIR